MQQIELGKTLDVEFVESRLAEMWQQSAGDADDEAALLRARVANLLIFVPREPLLNEVEEMLPSLTAIHPSRVLVMLGLRQAEDRDIEMSVASFCESDKRTRRNRLCCEEVTMKAQGSFAAELPSAALPLVVSDLSTFLWWRDALQSHDKIFDRLVRATDRLVIDSLEIIDPHSQLLQINKLFSTDNYKQVGISDLNWARLTLWRGLLADFYDVPAHHASLDQIVHVRVDYVEPAQQPTTVAPQALLITGWLASRLGWTLQSATQQQGETVSFQFSSKHDSDLDSNRDSDRDSDRGSSPTVREGAVDREINVDLVRVAPAKGMPGRLVEVKLESDNEYGAAFSVQRSEDNVHIVAEARLGGQVQRGRTLPVRNRSLTQLLSREMEILCNDNIYQEAVATAAKMIDAAGLNS